MKIEELTFFRFIAASIVVIFHFGRDATGFSGVLVSGPQMVTFFFVLSGFVMGVSYLNKEISNKSYWWARVARIMPVYVLAIALMVLPSYLKGQEINNLSLALNLSFLQSWFSPHPLSINGPGWSLSVEAFFYLMFPFVLYMIKAKNLSIKQMMVVSLAMWGVTQAITTGILSSGLYGGYPSFTHDLIYYFPLTHFCSFILGISGAMWIMDKKYLITNEIVSFILVGIATLLVITSLNNQSELSALVGLKFAFGSSFFAPLFLVFIIAITLCRSRLIKTLSAKPLVLLGEASFSLYILQTPVHRIYENYIYRIYENYLSGLFVLSSLQSFIIFFIFLTIISIISFLLFEKPAMKYIRYSLPVMLKKQLTRT